MSDNVIGFAGQAQEGVEEALGFTKWDLPDARDKFAMFALAGLLASSREAPEIDLCEEAWDYAEAMMAVRAERSQANGK